MQELLREILENGETAIDSWIERKISENLNFDCKLKNNNNTSKLENSERKHLGKTISAFSNSDGGLLIWGVDARLNEGVDCVTAKMPIKDVAVFRSQVEQIISKVISPPVADIRFFEIESLMSPGSGYLAILVPASERRPHISRTNDFPGFFFRNGHRSLLMEVFQIRDQMLRQTIPRLELGWEIRVLASEMSFNNKNQIRIPVSVDLVLTNNPNASAQFPYLIFEFDRSLYISLGATYEALARSCPSLTPLGSISATQRVSNPAQLITTWEFSGGANYCIHPGVSMSIVSIKLSASATKNSHLDDNKRVQVEYFSPQYDLMPKLMFSTLFGCFNAPLEKQHLEITANQMLSQLFKSGQSGDVILTYGSANVTK